MLFSSFSTRSMVFAYFAKAQLPFSLFRDLFNDTAEFTLCYGLHDCSPLFQGYFIHSLSTLYYYNAPSLATRLTGDYRDRTYTGKCSPALLDTRKKRKRPPLRFNAKADALRCGSGFKTNTPVGSSSRQYCSCPEMLPHEGVTDGSWRYYRGVLGKVRCYESYTAVL